MKIYLASDHAGFELKERIKNFLVEKGLDVKDMGTYSTESANWAEFGAKAAAEVAQVPGEARGILVCGSGIGMSIVANKFKNVRAALCHDECAAQMCRKHNDANILCLGARVIDPAKSLAIVQAFLDTPFEAGRHQLRLQYLDEIEKSNLK